VKFQNISTYILIKAIWDVSHWCVISDMEASEYHHLYNMKTGVKKLIQNVTTDKRCIQLHM
jgi:hypothetical protein